MILNKNESDGSLTILNDLKLKKYIQFLSIYFKCPSTHDFNGFYDFDNFSWEHTQQQDVPNVFSRESSAVDTQSKKNMLMFNFEIWQDNIMLKFTSEFDFALD